MTRSQTDVEVVDNLFPFCIPLALSNKLSARENAGRKHKHHDTAMNAKKSRTLIKDCMAILLLLPVTGVALYHIKRAIYARADDPITWEATYRTWLPLTAELLIPLMLGALAAWIVSRRGRPGLSVGMGILTIAAVYTVMYLSLLQCDTKINLNCGEGAAFVLLQWMGMFIINAIAMVGLSYWFNKLNKRRTSSPAS